MRKFKAKKIIRQFIYLFIVPCIATLTPYSTHAQKFPSDTIPPKAGGYPKTVLKKEKENHRCRKHASKKFSAILKNYPYNKAARLQLVSFKQNKLPVENNTIHYALLNEVITLNLSQIDSLTHIIFNIGYGGPILIEEEIACYQPRNAILFLNNKDELMEYIEICFECKQFLSSNEAVDLGEQCNEKFDLIKKQFLNAGIYYGTQ